jgi:hypothetical protein
MPLEVGNQAAVFIQNSFHSELSDRANSSTKGPTCFGREKGKRGQRELATKEIEKITFPSPYVVLTPVGGAIDPDCEDTLRKLERRGLPSVVCAATRPSTPHAIKWPATT